MGDEARASFLKLGYTDERARVFVRLARQFGLEAEVVARNLRAAIRRGVIQAPRSFRPRERKPWTREARE